MVSGLETAINHLAKTSIFNIDYQLEQEIMADETRQRLSNVLNIIENSRAYLDKKRNDYNILKQKLDKINTGSADDILEASEGVENLESLQRQIAFLKNGLIESQNSIVNKDIPKILEFIRMKEPDYTLTAGNTIGKLNQLHDTLYNYRMQIPEPKFSDEKKAEYKKAKQEIELAAQKTKAQELEERRLANEQENRRQNKTGFWKGVAVAGAIGLATTIGAYFIGNHDGNKDSSKAIKTEIVNPAKSAESEKKLPPYHTNGGVKLIPGGDLYSKVLHPDGMSGLGKALKIEGGDNVIAYFAMDVSDANKLKRTDVNGDRIYADDWKISDLPGNVIFIPDSIIKEYNITDENIKTVYEMGLGKNKSASLTGKKQSKNLPSVIPSSKSSDKSQNASIDTYVIPVNDLAIQYNRDNNLSDIRASMAKTGKTNLDIALSIYQNNYMQADRDSYMSIADITQMTGVSKHQIYKNTGFRRSKADKTNPNTISSPKIQYAVA